MEDGQTLHLSLWKFLLECEKCDIDQYGMNVVHQSYLDLIQLKEFELMENRILISKFEYSESNKEMNNLKEYRELVWKTALYAYE